MATVRLDHARRLLALLSTLVVAACGGGGSDTQDGGTATLRTIVVSAPAGTVAKGLTLQLTATGHYSDASTKDLTSTATWSSDDPSVTVDTAGLATGALVGSANVSATVGTVTGSLPIGVTAPVVVYVTVDPPSASVAKGKTQGFTATGHYSDLNQVDLTTAATWSADPAVATVSAAGVATGVGAGSTSVTATWGGVSGIASLTVSAPELVRIEVDPSSTQVAVAGTVPFTAWGVLSDGSRVDYTTQAAWSASGAAATIGAATGVATGQAAGSSTITAAYGLLSATAQLEVTAATLTSITVAPASASVAKGRTQPFTATATFSDTSTRDVTAVVVWESSDPTVATVDAAGLATGVGVGAATLTATWGGLSDGASLSVTAAQLESVTVTPPAISVALGYTERFHAIAVYSDGVKVDVGTSAAWAVAPGTVASVDGSGLVTPLSTGSATVTATWGGLSGSGALTVTAATLQTLALTPADPVLPLGVTQQLSAIGVFSDGSKLDLTGQVSWSTGDASVATVSAGGLVTPVKAAANPITVTAAHGGVQGQTSVTVTSATLVEISVTPAVATIAAGTTEQFTATGIYSDASTQDLTALVAWSSSDPSVTISNAAGTEGLATGAAPGSAQVTATLGALTDVSALTVTAATLQAIAITPPDATLPFGLTLQLTATGTFSDGTTQDLTTQVAWVSSDPSVAVVSNVQGQEGLASALNQGAVTVEAIFEGVTGSTTLTVTDATVQSIQVLPSGAALPTGYKLRFTAIATYTDATTLDVTADATWSSSAPAVATVSNAVGTEGLVTGVSAGSTNIRATLGGVTGSTGLTVVNTRLQSLTVTPNPFTVQVRGKLQMTAVGRFQNGSTLDVTGQVSWSSSNKKIATISRAGVVTGVKVGSLTVQASKGAVKSARVPGTVTP